MILQFELTKKTFMNRIIFLKFAIEIFLEIVAFVEKDYREH